MKFGVLGCFLFPPVQCSSSLFISRSLYWFPRANFFLCQGRGACPFWQDWFCDTLHISVERTPNTWQTSIPEVSSVIPAPWGRAMNSIIWSSVQLIVESLSNTKSRDLGRTQIDECKPQGKTTLQTSVRVKTNLYGIWPQRLRVLWWMKHNFPGQERVSSFTLLRTSPPTLCPLSSWFLQPKQNCRSPNKARKVGQLDFVHKGKFGAKF